VVNELQCVEAVGSSFVFIPVVIRGDGFESFRYVALFAVLVWLGSGLANLYAYIRHTQPPAAQAA